MTTRHHIVACAFALAVLAGPVRSDGDGDKLDALVRQVEALQSRVAALESLTTLTSFMPNFAERFHVMHHAGEAGDWAIASHELQEMQRMAALSEHIDAEKGQLLKSMLAPSFEALEGAIEHGNAKRFQNALAQTVGACNACHTATGSEFVKVTLDVPDLMSMRHPHKLARREAPEGHSHAMPAADRGTMHDSEGAPGHHDDAGKAKHTH